MGHPLKGQESPQQWGKKKQKKGKNADLSLDEALKATSSDEGQSEKSSGLSKKACNAFAGLDVGDADNSGGDDGSQGEDPTESPAPVLKGKKKKKKKKVDNAFALLDEDSDGDAQGGLQPTVGSPDEPVMQVLSKKKKQKKSKNANGAWNFIGGDQQGDIDGADINGTEDLDARGQEGKRGKAQSAFAALMPNDYDEEPDSDGPSVSEKESNSLKHHHSRTASSTFSALSVDEEDIVEQDAPTKGSKAKTSKATDSAFAALADDFQQGKQRTPHSEEDAAVQASDASRPKDKKKKKKAKGGKGDIDDVFAALGEEDDTLASTAGSVTELAGFPQGKKKSRTKKGKGEEDIDALLVELDGKPDTPVEAHAGKDDDGVTALEQGNSITKSQTETALSLTTPDEKGSSIGKKKKKKKAKGSKNVEEDIDAILAEIDGPSKGMEQSNEVPEAKTPPTDQKSLDNDADLGETGGSSKRTEQGKDVPEMPVAPPGEKSQDLDEDILGDKQEGTKELSAAQKKKLKKKQKEKEKKLAKTSSTAADEEDVGLKPKGKDSKVPLHVRRLQEEMERRRLREEQLKKEEEERLKREEEERKREEEEEIRQREEAERKKKERAEKQKHLKILAKQKADEEKRARALKLLVNANQSPEDTEDAKTREKLSYAEKKKQRALELEARKKAEDEARLLALDEERKRKEELRKQEEEEQRRQAEQKAREDEGLDDWEEAADTWEDIDEDAPIGAQVDEEAAEKVLNVDAELSESESEEESSSEEESTSYETDSEEAKERMIAEAKQKRAARVEEAKAQASADDLRSPICCILGHVDTGKTKILDNVRRTNVQDGEAGGITQQIGATYIPSSALMTRTEDLRKGREYDMKVPGLLVIDTPGHESFTNLRSRGSSLCDIAILVVDLMHGLEPQTVESIGLLRQRKTPFIVALNKVDRLIDWKTTKDAPIRDSLNRQKKHTTSDFEDRLTFCTTQLMEQGLNVALYWKNKDPRKYVSMVPTSAITGEGIPDLLQLLVKLTTGLMGERLMFLAELQCTVLEVKAIEGLGTTIDVVLVNGMLKEGDKIVVCGMAGPITTTIRSLLTPHPLKELRVKGSYLHHKQIRAAQGIKICAQGLERAVAGTALYAVGPEDNEEEATALAQEEMEDVLGRIDRSGEGVSVQASTLGSLEALLDFLKSPEVSIPVSAIAIGPVHKKDVIRANVMNEKGLKKFGVILAFDVPVNREARDVAQELGVRVFTADIIYHLFDQFKAYMEEVKKAEKMAARDDAVFPCILKIIPTCIFNQKDPIVMGVEVVEGQARVGTPLCIPASAGRAEVSLGRIDSMEVNHKMVEEAKAGESFAVKIRATNSEESAKLYGRHFDHNDELYSRISRESIDALKQFFKDEMEKDDWRLVVKLKSVFKIQ